MQEIPGDFIFQLTKKEWEYLRSQFATSGSGKKGLRHALFCFTEQGVAMLSVVLTSETAIQVSIQIIRVFSRMREVLLTHKDILLHPDRAIGGKDGEKAYRA